MSGAGLPGIVVFRLRNMRPEMVSRYLQGIIPNYAAAKFVLQVPDNKADLVKLAAPCGFKYRTIFNSGGMHLLGEHSKLRQYTITY